MMVRWEQAADFQAELMLTDSRAHQLQLAELNQIGPNQIGPWYASNPPGYERLVPNADEFAEIVNGDRIDLV